METSVATGNEQTLHQNNLIGRLDRLPLLPFHRRLSALLGTGLLFAGLDIIAIAIILPSLLTTFHLSTAVGGALIGAVYIGQIIGSLALGALSEIFGRKRLYIISLLLFGVLSLASAAAPTFQTLLLLRILVGIPLGSIVPIATAYVSEYIPGLLRGRATAAVLFLYTLGFVLAPFLLAFVLMPISGASAWRILLGLGGLTLLLTPFVGRYIPESVRWLVHRERIDEAEKYVELLEQQALVHMHGQALGAAKVISPASISKKTRWGELFSKSYTTRTLLTWIRWFVGASVLAGFASWLPTLYTFVGMGQFQVQIFNILFGLCELVVLVVYMFLVDRIGRKRWFLIGFGIIVLGTGAGSIAFGILHSTSWVVLALTGIPLSMGGYICVINNFLSTAELFPTRMRAWALSTCKCVDALASIIVPIIIGIIATARSSIGAIFLLLFIFSLVALLAEARFGMETKLAILEATAP